MLCRHYLHQTQWRTVDIKVLNESKFLFQPSQVNPRVLKGCTLEVNDQSSSQSGWNIPPEFIDLRDEQSRLFELQGTDEGNGVALLTFDFGDLSHKLVIYVQMNPEQNSAGIRVSN
jgi:hypothetical protein